METENSHCPAEVPIAVQSEAAVFSVLLDSSVVFNMMHHRSVSDFVHLFKLAGINLAGEVTSLLDQNLNTVVFFLE